MTNLVDVVLDADGTPASGQVTLHWPMFMLGQTPVTQGQKTFEITEGALNLNLFPTTSALPTGSYYTANFQLDNGAVYDEYWTVPDAAAPVKLNNVRAMFPPAPGLFINVAQLTGGNAKVGQFLGWNDNQWVPMNVTMLNVTPNTINLTVTANSGGDITDITVPVDSAMLGSGLSVNIPDAGPTTRGVVTTGAQTFAGQKTFQGLITFSNSILLSPSSGPSGPPAPPGLSPWGSIWFDQNNTFRFIGGLSFANPDGSHATLTVGALQVTYLDVSMAGLSHTVASPQAVTFPGEESILLPSTAVAHGIGVDVNGWLWLGSGNSFASLRPDAAWVSSWIDLSPYQHPINAGDEAIPSQSSIVLYRDATQWLGMGVDNAMRIWFRVGPNGAGTYYYLHPDGGSLGVYTWVDNTLVAQRAGINLISGQYVTITAADNFPNNTVDVVISAAGNLVDPTTHRGDLIVRGQNGIGRLPAIYDNQYRVLTCDPAHHLGLSWTVGVPTSRRIIAGAGLWGGGDLSGDVDIWANVLSVFGRTGNIVLTGADIINAGGVMDPTLIKGDLIVRSPWLTVNRGLTRLGAGIDGSVLVTDSTLDLGMKWVPGGEFGAQTPWLQDVYAAGFSLFDAGSIERVGLINDVGSITNVGSIGIGTGTPAHALDVVGDGAVSGDFSVGGDLNVAGATNLSGDLGVDGNFTVAGTSTLTGDVALGADFDVVGNSSLGGNLDVAGNGGIAGDFAVGGVTTLSGDLSVTGDSALTGLFSVTGDSSFTGDVAVTGDTALTGAFAVTGDSALTGDLAVDGAFSVTGASTLTGDVAMGADLDVAGDATVQGDLEVVGNFITGGTMINGALNVTGDSTLGGDLDVTGDTTLGGTLDVTGDSTFAGDVAISGELEVATISSGSTTPVVFAPPLEAGQIDLNPDIDSWGNVQGALASIFNSITTLSRGMSYVGSYDAANDVATFVPSLASLNGPLPAADATGLEQGDFLIATSDAAGPPAIQMGDQLISGGPTGGANWDILSVGHVAITASMVALSPQVGSWTEVQTAIADIANGAAQTPWLSNINADGYMLVSGSTSYDLTFGTGVPTAPTERMRILSTGNVGIGNNGATLAGDAANGLRLSVGSTTTSTAPGRLNLCANTANQAGLVGTLNFINAAFTTASDLRLGMIECRVDVNQNGGFMAFFTNAGGATTAISERMRIGRIGYVGIGNDAATAPQAGTQIHLMVGSFTAATPGMITACINTTANNAAAGGFQAANYAITATEKRLAALTFYRGTADNTGYIAVFTNNAGTFSERMRILASGNVGINSTSDAYRLTVGGDINITTGSSYRINGVVLDATMIPLNPAIGTFTTVQQAVAAAQQTPWQSNINANGYVLTSGTTTASLQFATGTAASPTTRLIILSSGNVGIGTATPNNMLSVYGDVGVGDDSTSTTVRAQTLTIFGRQTATNAVIGTLGFRNMTQTGNLASITALRAAANNTGAVRINVMNAGVLEPWMGLNRADAGVFSDGVVKSDTWTTWVYSFNTGVTASTSRTLGILNIWSGMVGTGELGHLIYANWEVPTEIKRCAQISCYGGADPYHGELRFSTRPAGQTTAPTERVRITASGDMGIGSTAPAGRLHVVGNIVMTGQLISGATNTPLIFATGTGASPTERVRIPTSGGLCVGNTLGAAPGQLNLGSGNTGVTGTANLRFCGNQATADSIFATLSLFNYANASGQEVMKIDWLARPGSGDASSMYAATMRMHLKTSSGGGNYMLTVNENRQWHFSAGLGGTIGIGMLPTYQLQLSNDSAAKPSTNTWTIASDHRVKRNLRSFDGGLETVRQLEPTLAEYNGCGGTPDGARVVSLDPYKLRDIVPNAVSSVRGKLNEDDEEETDLLGVNTHEVFYHMLRAIQQLDREVRQLKGEL